jgi:hypothetical protein
MLFAKLGFGDCSGYFQKPVRERGLAVVNMGNDNEIPDILLAVIFHFLTMNSIPDSEKLLQILNKLQRQ